MHYLAREILEQLDSHAEDFTFPMLDNGYVYLTDCRLLAFRDETRWVLLIEVLGFNYRGGGHGGVDNCLYLFGNCFTPSEAGNMDFLFVTDDSPAGSTFDTEDEASLNPGVHYMLLRGQEIAISHDVEFYQSKGIELEAPPKIMIWEFLRGIVPDHRTSFLASDVEIRQRIPQDLPLILQLNEWHHNDLANGEKPSENETFQMIARVLETGNPALYQPTKEPNTHWSNWPEGGTL